MTFSEYLQEIAPELLPALASTDGYSEDDFPKYGKKINVNLLQAIFKKVPATIGKKVKYHNFGDQYPYQIKNSLEWLQKALLILPAIHTNCAGIPLIQGANEQMLILSFPKNHKLSPWRSRPGKAAD